MNQQTTPSQHNKQIALPDLPEGHSGHYSEDELKRYAVDAVSMNLPQSVEVDALAQEIRRVNGDNKMGAGALAEAIVAFLESAK